VANRVIKDSIYKSKKLARCSYEAQLHYHRLYLLIDDWSCVEIDIEIMRCKAYPKLLKKVSEDLIEGFLIEYRKNGLLFTWTEGDGQEYGYFTGKEEGRLPPPSKRHLRHTPEPPKEKLEKYISKFNGVGNKATARVQPGYDEGTVKVQSPSSNHNHNHNHNPNHLKDKSDNPYRTLSLYLEELILKNNPKAKVVKNKEKWDNTVRLMLEIDGRSIEEIKKVIEISQKDEFWLKNVLSMDKVRKHFDKLTLIVKGGEKDEQRYNF